MVVALLAVQCPGIDNIFDKKAPFLTSWNDANTDVMTYDLHGRRGYVKVSVSF